MSKIKFEVELEGTATIEIDDAVLNAVDESFRKNIYNLKTTNEIMEHLAYNLIINQFRLSSLDGWADQPDSNAKVSDEYWDIRCINVTKT